MGIAVISALVAGWQRFQKLMERAENSSALDLLTKAIEMFPDDTEGLKGSVMYRDNDKIEASVDRLDREGIARMLKDATPSVD